MLLKTLIKAIERTHLDVLSNQALLMTGSANVGFLQTFGTMSLVFLFLLFSSLTEVILARPSEPKPANGLSTRGEEAHHRVPQGLYHRKVPIQSLREYLLMTYRKARTH